MSNLWLFWIVWVMLFVAACAGFLLVKRRERLPQEDMTPLRGKFTCGGVFRYKRMTLRLAYPFVQVRLYDDFFVISHIGFIKLGYRNITRLSRDRRGLSIEHDRLGEPGRILLTAYTKELEQQLGRVV